MTLYSGKALAGALGLSTREVENLRKSGVIQYRKGTAYALEGMAPGTSLPIAGKKRKTAAVLRQTIRRSGRF